MLQKSLEKRNFAPGIATLPANADGYCQSPQDELPDMAARLYVTSGMSLQRVV